MDMGIKNSGKGTGACGVESLNSAKDGTECTACSGREWKLLNILLGKIAGILLFR